MGEVAPRGIVRFKGQDIAGLESHRIARLGLGYVPENRDIFPMMTVRQNLILGIKDMKNPGRWSVEQMLDMFPNLRARADTAAGVLSGGEKQMLTICRTLMGDPRPDHDRRADRGSGAQDRAAGRRADRRDRQGRASRSCWSNRSCRSRCASRARVYVMGHGEIVYSGTPADFATRDDIRKEWLEV